MIDERSSVIQLVSKYICLNIVNEIPAGQNVVIREMNAETASQLAVFSNQMLKSIGAKPIRLFALGAVDNFDEFTISAQKAIEFRNSSEPMILLAPTSNMELVASLAGFRNYRMTEILSKLIDESSRKLFDFGIPQLSTETIHNILKMTSLNEFLNFLLIVEAAENPVEAFGISLPYISLIADTTKSVMSVGSLERNLQISIKLSAKLNPLRDPEDLLNSVGILPGPTRDAIKKSFMQERVSGKSWTQVLALNEKEEFLLSNWPLVEKSSSKLALLEVKSFLGSNGKVNPKCKLKLHPTRDVFVATGKVQVEWVVLPKIVASELVWHVDLLDSADIDLARPVLSYKVANKTRSKTLDLSNLDEDGVAVRIRLSAMSKDGTQVLFEDGTPAVAYSESFLLQDEIDDGVIEGGAPEERVAQSIGSGLLMNAMQNRNLKEISDDTLGRPDRINQSFEFALENTLTKVRISTLIYDLTKNSVENLDVLIKYEAHFRLTENPLSLDDIQKQNGILPESLLLARRDFLASLIRSEIIYSPEIIFWDPIQQETLSKYVDEFHSLVASGDQESIKLLEDLDQLNLHIYTPNGIIEATILLPTHPLRALWLRTHYLTSLDFARKLLRVNFSNRGSSFEMSLFESITPENLPFALSTSMGTRLYADELIFGTGIYLPVQVNDVSWELAVISQAIGVKPSSRSREISKKISGHLCTYDAGNQHSPGLKLIAVNPGDGSMIAGALDDFLKTINEERANELRLEVSTYSQNYSYTAPVEKLINVQANMNSLDNEARHLLLPKMSIKAMDLQSLENDSNAACHSSVALIQSPAQMNLTASSNFGGDDFPTRSPHLNGLISYVYEIPANQRDTHSIFAISTGPTGEGLSLGRLHEDYLRTTCAPNLHFTFEIGTTDSMANLVNVVHDRSDWVLTADRYLGLNLYENILKKSSRSPVVLDYSPDFVDGFGDRLTLTTTKPREVSRILHSAMQSLGIEEGPEKNAESLLRTLSQVSGRLAMRLLSDNTLAKEAVGICATISFLEDEGELDSTVIIPVDAHQDMFKFSKHDPEADAKRCDLIFVRFNEGRIVLELVEVKARSHAEVGDLPEVMKNQLDNSERLLNHLLFNTDEVRIDSSIQWARWASILHFYIDRGVLHGRISKLQAVSFHSLVESSVGKREVPQLTKSGYIVSVNANSNGLLGGAAGYKIRVLADVELQASGYKTVKQHLVEMPFRPEEVAPVGVLHTNEDVKSNHGPDRIVEVGPTFVNQQETKEAESQVTHENNIKVILGRSRSSETLSWKVSLSGSPHGVIVGISGQGKSVTTRNILKQFSQQGLPSIVFDFHGDMGSHDEEDTNYVKVAEHGLPFSPFDFDKHGAIPIKTASLEISEILKSIGGLGDIQANHVNQALRMAYTNLGWTDSGGSGSRFPSVSEFVDCLEIVEAQNKGKNASARLQSFTDYELFRDGDTESFKVLNPKGYVFDVSKYRLEEVKVTAGAFILRRIYNEMFQWEPTSKPRLAVVLDEAHRLSKDPTIPKIMKEGRKFGIIVLLVSQSMKDFAPEVIDNAGLKIAFRTNFPASKEVASFLQSKDSNQISTIIEGLNTGYALVSTPEMKNVEKVEMLNAD